MLNLFMDGFDQFYGSTVASSALQMAGYETTGTPTLAAGRYEGSNSLVLNKSSVTRSVVVSGGKCTFGFSCYYSERGTLARMGDMGIWTDKVDGRLTYTRPDGTLAKGGVLPVRNRWYYYEFALNQSANTLTVFVNQRADLVLPLTPTLLSAVSVDVTLAPGGLPSTSEPGKPSTDSGQRRYDDFYTVSGDPIGAIVITTRIPSVDGDAQWEPIPDGPHFAIVSQRPPKFLDEYVRAKEPGKVDTYRSGTPLPNANPIVAVGMVALVRKTDVTAAYMGVGMAVGGKELYTPLTIEWGYKYAAFPADAGDTPTAVLEQAFGLVVRGTI